MTTTILDYICLQYIDLQISCNDYETKSLKIANMSLYIPSKCAIAVLYTYKNGDYESRCTSKPK